MNSCESSGKAFVVLKDVSKNFGQFRALDKVSFEIAEGEIFGYIGPNGAGKTTTMKILIGLITEFQGEARIGSCSIPAQKAEAHKLLGYLPQNVAFQEWRTVNHALKTFGKLSGLSDAETEKRIPETLELVGLAEVRHKKISNLSGGMTQRVGLAQALLHNPRLLVLDEPLGGLDPLSRRQFKDIVLQLSKKGTTVLFSSHILSDVQDVADRVGILSRGKILRVGSVKELRSRLAPENIVEVLLSFVSGNWKQLGTVRGVKAVEQPSPGRILVHLEAEADADLVVGDIVQATVKLDLRVRGVSVLSPSLDEIYFRHVQEVERA